jgi:pimeloyl-ACP methyl ester carboxylesterase
MSNPQFIHFPTPDGLTLPGLFYESPNSKKAAIYLHGNGSSSVFYSEDYTLAEEMQKNGISYLLFNNRGAHIIKKLNKKVDGAIERKSYGCAYEIIKECVEDIDGAIRFLEEKGYEEFFLIGASTGANKICVYDHYKPNNKVSKYILLGGGDDTGMYYSMLGSDKFWRLLKESKEKIQQEFGTDLIKELLPNEIFSYQAFSDIANPDGDYNGFPFYEVINQTKLSTKPLFHYFQNIKKPSLVVYGELDEFAWGDIPRVEAILKQYQPTFTYHIVPQADHGFHEKKKELSQILIPWIKKQK